MIDNKQKGDTEKIVEPESGGKGAKEYLEEFSEQILLKLNPNMRRKNVENERYREAMSPKVAEHVVIDRETLKRNVFPPQTRQDARRDSSKMTLSLPIAFHLGVNVND